MATFLTIVALAMVLAIAAVVVGRETRRLASVRVQKVFEFEEAVAWVCEHVPFEVAAVLSPDDVRSILNWHLEHFRTKGISGNGTGQPSEEPVFVTTAESVQFVLDRASATGADYTPEQVHAVLEAEMGYLADIGALGEDQEGDGASAGA